MLTIFSITTANPIWDITRRGEIPQPELGRSPLPFLCPSSLFDATRSVHFSTQESSANLEPSGVRRLKRLETQSQAMPQTYFLPRSSGQLDSTALELVSQELSVYKGGILHIVLSLRLKF